MKPRKHCGTVSSRLCIGQHLWPLSERSRSSPFCAGFPVQEKAASDASTGWVGTSSHGLVCGPNLPWPFDLGQLQSRHGWTTTIGREQSTCWLWRGWRRAISWQTLCRPSGMPWSSIARMCQAVLPLRIYMKHSEAGSWDTSCGEIPEWRCHQEPKLLQMSATDRSGPWQDGLRHWWQNQSIAYQQFAASVGRPHGVSALSAGWLHAGVAPTQEMKMQHAARRAFKMEEQQGMSCQQHSVGRPQGASCRGSSDNLPTTDVAIKDEAQPMGPYLGLWIFFAMAGLVTTGRSKVANCGNGGRDAWLPVQEGPAASSSSSPPGQGGPAT